MAKKKYLNFLRFRTGMFFQNLTYEERRTVNVDLKKNILSSLR